MLSFHLLPAGFWMLEAVDLGENGNGGQAAPAFMSWFSTRLLLDLSLPLPLHMFKKDQAC